MIGKFNTIGKEEEEAVLRVIRSGNLSGYVATKLAGGPEVEALQNEWADFFGTHDLVGHVINSHAVACNSATSGLLAACMACGVGPHDEVIVPYYTMSATAAAPAVLGANVVLANIDPDHFCIDPADVGRLINENTKAVIATNLFGHPAQLRLLRSMCDAAGIFLIEDNAQAIMAKEDGVYTGTIGHIGVFSLNVHKHIQTGEGGICFTHSGEMARKLKDAINHGEARNAIPPGLNLRMTELTAAVARAQLNKLPAIVASRKEIGWRLDEAFTGCEYVSPCKARAGCEHTYYAYPLVAKVDVGMHSLIGNIRSWSPIPIGAMYDGNILTKPVASDWATPERIKELYEHDAYKNVHRLLLIETCSYDIKESHIEKLKTNLVIQGWKRDDRY